MERKIYQSITLSFRDIAKLLQYTLYHIISQM
nr:MAG TPA: hypothetical protein [Caudoviricetes sp.]